MGVVQLAVSVLRLDLFHVSYALYLTRFLISGKAIEQLTDLLLCVVGGFGTVPENMHTTNSEPCHPLLSLQKGIRQRFAQT